MNEIIDIVIKSFYFVLPAYCANMAPVIFDRLGILKFLNYPIDGGRKWGSDYIFGSGKTWRGIVAAAVVGVLISGLQSMIFQYDFFKNISVINYQTIWVAFGFLAGLGAILGDLFKSFFKRRIGIGSGKSWPIFDQVDFIAGFVAATYFITSPSVEIIIAVFLMTLILHPLTNITAYFLGIKKVWW